MQQNDRPVIEVVIPVQRWTAQLDTAVAALEAHTDRFLLSVVEEPDLNVSEARQKALEEIVTHDLVCFLDDDSEMIQSGWLDALYRVMEEQEDAGAVFAGEWWGTDDRPTMKDGGGGKPAIDHKRRVWTGQGEPFTEVDYGPAACMLLDRRRLPAGLSWDSSIGLRSGWLGGDFEEVDYCYRLSKLHGLRLYRATRTLFHHTGGKLTHRDFVHTDRFRTANVMKLLLNYKYAKAPYDEDWFRGLKYVPARDDDDCLLAPGHSLREAYYSVIKRNGLGHVRSLRRMGLVD